MTKRIAAILAVMLALSLMLGFFSAASGQGETPGPTEKPRSDATVQPRSTMEAESSEAESSQDDSLTNSTQLSGMTTGGCPMMSGTMTGSSTMSGATTSMSGMAGMGSMAGMTGVSNMTGMNGTTNITGMNGMSSMTGMQNMSGNQAMGAAQMLGEQQFSLATLNPWWVLGWLVLVLFVLALTIGLIVGVVLLIRGQRRRQPVQAAG